MNKNKKTIIIAAICIVCICGVVGIVTHNKINNNVNNELSTNDKTNKSNNVSQAKEKVTTTASEDLQKEALQKTEKVKKQSAEPDENSKSANLYNDIPASALPLSAIAEMPHMPVNVQDTITKITDTNNIYMIQKHNDKLFIITDNPGNIRHNVEFTEINISNGHQIHTTLGYNDKIKDSDNDIWEYDNETHQPKKHTKYNADGDMEFVEEWSYDSENPIKYEMKNAEGKVVSMRKETLQDGTDLRIEHLVYDNNGNTKINVSATYEGSDIKRFTYYNADKINQSGSVFSEYNEGQKTKETIYTSDFKVKNTYTSNYKDGIREDITKWDNKNKEVETYIQIDTL